MITHFKIKIGDIWMLRLAEMVACLLNQLSNFDSGDLQSFFFMRTFKVKHHLIMAFIEELIYLPLKIHNQMDYFSLL